MTRKEIKQALAEINRPGSELQKQYLEWCNNKMTNMVADVLQYLSNPDQTITTVPAIGGDSACTLLGYVSGRSHSAADMVGLDELIPQEDSAVIPDNYEKGGIE